MFNPTIALEYARLFARPRQVGSGEDEKVANEIADKLASFGYQVTRQPFSFTTSPGRFLTMEIILGQILIAVTMILQRRDSWALVIPAAALLLMLAVANPAFGAALDASLLPQAGTPAKGLARFFSRLGQVHRSENIMATLSSPTAPRPISHLYLVAHYDSKSQNVPLIARILFFGALLIGTLIFATLSLIGRFFPAVVAAIPWLGLVTLLAGIPLLFLDFGNESPGALDNASGVGVLLHLAETLIQSECFAGNLEITILFTGAEELGAIGARAFVQQNAEVLHRQVQTGNVSVLNFDGTGTRGHLCFIGKPHPSTGSRLAEMVRKAQSEVGYTIRQVSLPGALFDHMPFSERGIDSGSLATLGKTTWVVHTPADRPEILAREGFAQAGCIACAIIEYFYEHAQDKKVSRHPPLKK